MNFNETPEFLKEYKQLLRKYRSLPEDLEDFRKIIGARPIGASRHFHVLKETKRLQIVKARLACRYLKGSTLRVVYAYIPNERRIEFIELYFKGDKGTEDRDRIKRYLATQTD